MTASSTNVNDTPNEDFFYDDLCTDDNLEGTIPLTEDNLWRHQHADLAGIFDRRDLDLDPPAIMRLLKVDVIGMHRLAGTIRRRGDYLFDEVGDFPEALRLYLLASRIQPSPANHGSAAMAYAMLAEGERRKRWHVSYLKHALHFCQLAVRHPLCGDEYHKLMSNVVARMRQLGVIEPHGSEEDVDVDDDYVQGGIVHRPETPDDASDQGCVSIREWLRSIAIEA